MKDIQLEPGQAIRFTSGIPDVAGLPCDAITAGEAGEYMRRYHLEYTRNRSARFHHILAGDPSTDLHDHPWDYTTIILAGSYTEVTPDGAYRYAAPCILTRRATQLHRLVLDDGPVWTWFSTGPVCRRWGFMTSTGWVPWQQHARGTTAVPCEPVP